ncbi:hypothetical protein F4678DRAFT_457945 [Xylaria arbuscula]|nr:hypothetical protein F4678DRAFT_457945 [Xylaria arbuscula]
MTPSQIYPDPDPDPPPSYAEATGTNDTRRHTLTTTITPVYSLRNTISASTSIASMFPQVFSLYSRGSRHYVIGISQDVPLYAVSTHSFLSSRPDVIIHNGVSLDTLPLATIVHEPFSRSASITLPARPGSRHPATRELLESVGAFTRILRFGIETTAAAAGRGRREYFEWRHSSGAEVEALEGRPHSGWKLVRVPLSPVPVPIPLMTTAALRDTAVPIAPRPRSMRKNKSSGGNINNYSHDNQSDSHSLLGYNSSNSGSSSSSGRKEVVAVCAGTGMWSVTKVLYFRFLGAGADGSLGDRWAIMAVASALAIWNRDRRSRSAAPAVISAGF